MRAITSTPHTSHALRTVCVAVAAMIGLSLLAVVEQQHTASVPSTVVADGPIVAEPHEEWDSRG
ncbi:hypothetical protein ACFY8C_18450 [Streptomyces flavochromogenes]|uniref:Secreted protein n=1 Tax=Streptomyces flavochromogenes TaxID=68199 RepID=A0ABW6XSC9_9ACTN|nr:hypothetical protein [Streptomyces flavochromogenes]